MNRKLIIQAFIATFIMLFFIPNLSSIKALEQTEIQTVMDGINAKRTELNLKPLEIDDNLCQLAQKLSDDSEVAYPDELNLGLLQSDLTYKEYLQEYSLYESNKLTVNDVLVEAVGGQKEFLKFNEDSLIRNFTQESGLGNSSLTPELEYGCVGASTGELGYKPFGYFVGGIKKEPILSFPQNIIQAILSYIANYFK
ncbi:MAG: hypothetical protein O3B87_01910 [bacterium]|nr:hypothetical protein [bacterium]